MNERDYLIFETMTITTGIMIIITMVTIYVLHDLPIYHLIILLPFIGFMMFTIGLFIHMKRKILVYEMKEEKEKKRW